MMIRTAVSRSCRYLVLALSLGLGWQTAFGQEAAPIQEWIDEAIKQGGGVVTIPPGEHVLPKGLVLKDAKKLAIRGMDKETCILKLPPLAYAECAEAAPAGTQRLKIRAARHWQPGMQLHIEADGEIESFTKKPRPYVRARIEEVRDTEFVLKEPLKFPIPAGAIIRHADAPNLIVIRGASEQVEIANLTLDGGRVEGDPHVRGHTQLCAVLAMAPYSYEAGPKGPKIKNVMIRDCILQNLFGRAAAFYSVEKAAVERCSISDVNDEAVDFDHFTEDCVARGNRINRCKIGFELNDANSTLIEGNEVANCEVGLNLWRWCKQPDLNKGNIIRNNLFKDSGGNAIQIARGTAENIIENNEIDGAGRNGISLAGSKQTLRGNRISGVKLKEVAVVEGQHQIEPKPNP